MKIVFFVVAWICAFNISAMEQIIDKISRDWIDLGGLPSAKFNDDFAKQREIIAVEHGLHDRIQKLINEAFQSNGLVSIYALQSFNDELKKGMFERGDNLAKRFDRGCDFIIRIPNIILDEKWPLIARAYKKKRLGESVRLSPVDDRYDHRRCYIHIADCFNDMKEMREIMLFLEKKLNLYPKEYQPTSYFHLGIRETRQIEELNF